MKIRRAFPLLWLALALPCSAFIGYETSGIKPRWDLVALPPNVHTNVVNPQSRAIRFYVASDGYSAINTVAEQNAIRAAFGQWQSSVTNSLLKFEDAGTVPAGVDVNLADNTNVVFWTKNSTWVNGGFDDIGDALGTTFFNYDQDTGRMDNADIVLNGFKFRWFTDFNDTTNTSAFVEEVTLHEIGHLLGFDHANAGGATLFYGTRPGIGLQLGLSADDVAAVRAYYSPTNRYPDFGCLKGRVTMGGNGVLGAMVFLEDLAGNLASATLTRAGGFYEFPAALPASYQVRVTPMDDRSANPFLVQEGVFMSDFANSVVNFFPTDNQAVTLTAGTTNTFNFTITAGTPPFRIAWLRKPSTIPDSYSITPGPVAITVGQSNYYIGVFSDNLPTSGATLSVTGDGVTLGEVTFQPGNFFPGLNGVSVGISIASNATPGLRSLVVTRNGDGAKAYANGFLEIRSALMDYNFDGLDDRFQRQYFPLFTAPEAAPEADPDRDGANNRSEFAAGTVPTNSFSVMKLESATTDFSGTTIRWQSVAGKQYQVLGKSTLGVGGWQNLGAPVAATNLLSEYLDVGATSGTKFYRVQVLP